MNGLEKACDVVRMFLFIKDGRRLGSLPQVLEVVVVLWWGMDGGGVAVGGEENNKVIIYKYDLLIGFL